MYKTVRHGENSLQYTILPQTEEVLNNSGMRGKGRDYSPSIHVRRSSRRYSVKDITIIICTLSLVIITALMAVYVLNQNLLDPWFQTSRRDIMSSVLKYRGEINKEVSSSRAIKSEATSTTSTTTYATTTVTVPTVFTTVERSTTPPWIMPALRSWKSSSTIQTIPTEGNDIPLLAKPRSKELTAVDNMSIKPWEKDTIIRPTATPESITLNSIIKYYSLGIVPSGKPIVATTKVFDDVLITTQNTLVTETTENTKLSDLKDAMLSVDDDDDFKESLEVDEVFSLPPLKPESPIDSLYFDRDVIVTKPASGWYGSRWPFVDTSSYFQWSGYSRGDNLLLPLLIGALSSIALVCLLVVAAKRRMRTQSASASSGHTTELAVDDNTNLLTAENGEDAEE